MEKIKYRAWDRKEKRMIYEALTIGDIGLGKGSVLAHVDVQKGNELDWMLYIGRKDRKGREIHAGDLVHGQWENEMGSFTPLMCEVFWCDGKLGYEARAAKNDNGFHWSIGEDVEVVGNKFENPELLK